MKYIYIFEIINYWTIHFSETSVNIYKYPSIIETGYLLTYIRETRRCDALF